MGDGRIGRLQQFFQMRHVVVAEDILDRAAMADALDHRGMVEFVGEDDQARQDLRQGRQRRVVGDKARGEQQRRFLAMQIGQLAVQLDMIMRGAGDVARAARTGARRVDRLMHRRQHLGMLAHVQIIVGAPDRDRTPAPVGAIRVRIEIGLGVVAALAHDVGEYPIAALPAERRQGILESWNHRKTPWRTPLCYFQPAA